MEYLTQLLCWSGGNLLSIDDPLITIFDESTFERVLKTFILHLELEIVVIRTSTNDLLNQSVGLHVCFYLCRLNCLKTELASEFSLIV